MKCSLFIVEVLSPKTGNWIFVKSYRTKKIAIEKAKKAFPDTGVRVLAYPNWFSRENGGFVKVVFCREAVLSI